MIYDQWGGIVNKADIYSSLLLYKPQSKKIDFYWKSNKFIFQWRYDPVPCIHKYKHKKFNKREIRVIMLIYLKLLIFSQMMEELERE